MTDSAKTCILDRNSISKSMIGLKDELRIKIQKFMRDNSITLEQYNEIVGHHDYKFKIYNHILNTDYSYELPLELMYILKYAFGIELDTEINSRRYNRILSSTDEVEMDMISEHVGSEKLSVLLDELTQEK